MNIMNIMKVMNIMHVLNIINYRNIIVQKYFHAIVCTRVLVEIHIFQIV